jgi:hypothetical protein
MPAGMRAHVLKLASSDTPEAVAHRAIVAQRATLFGHTGFPKPLDPPKPSWWRSRQGQVTAGGVAAAAVAATVIGVALAGGGPGNHAGQAALARGPTPSSTGAVPGRGPGPQTQRPQPTVSAGGVVSSSPRPVVAVAPSHSASGTVSAVASSGSPSASRSAHSSTPASPGLTPSPEPSSSGVTMGPNSPAATTPPPPSSSPPPSPGTLVVNPTSILLSVGDSATLTLTASNGPVSWSITESPGLVGGLTASQSSGTLAAGASTTVTVTATNLLTVGGQLTVQPGGITVTVVLSLL